MTNNILTKAYPSFYLLKYILLLSYYEKYKIKGIVILYLLFLQSFY